MSAATTSEKKTAELRRELIRLAAVDVGSNSIHMVVSQVDSDGGLTTLWRMKEPVGLGRMSFPNKHLTDAAMDAAVAVLSRFKQAATQRGAEKIIAIATSAIREAENGGDLIERFRTDARMTVRVISAREEARLIYLAVRHAFPLKQNPALIIDIGGGSVEFVVGDGDKSSLLESRKLGAARMTAMFVNSDPISKRDLEALRNHYESELGKILKDVESLKPGMVIGTSGTLENVAAMCADYADQENVTPGVIDRRAFEKLFADLLKSDSKSRGRFPGLDAQRKDQILAGAVLVDFLFTRLKLKKIVMCSAALREGIMLEYLSRHVPDLQVRREVPDPRRRAVLDLARRCDWHQKHSEHVTRLCLKLFDDLKSLHLMGSVERELIEFGGLLHDIGWHISGNKHHKHSMYLIQHGKLGVFSEEEIAIIANIARYHRKSAPKKRHPEYGALPPRARRIVDVGAALLRIADGLDRTHASVVRDVKAQIDEPKVIFRLDTRSDAQLEIWGAKRKAAWFQKVFKVRAEFLLRR